MGQNTITINGKLYDAKTGRLLGTSANTSTSQSSTTHQQPSGAALDGFSRRRSTSATKSTPAATVHAKTTKSQTLRRDSVRKPANPQIHSKATPPKSASHHKTTTEKTLHTNSDRATRAATVKKSKLVSRFGKTTSAPYQTTEPTDKAKKVAHVPIAQPPADQPPVFSLPKRAYANPFDTAVAHASSHTQPLHKTKTTRRQRIAHKLHIAPRTVSLATIAFAAILFGGFFVYQNIPTMAMRLASTRSGVAASMPGYKAAGFAVNGPITYSAGKISINYKSTTDDRSYAVTQSSSEWNNESLVDNFVAVERRPYQTYQDKGKTIYIYDGANATWVDGGVWYQVEGQSSLTSDQLLRIANSL